MATIELTGNLTVKSLQDANPEFIKGIQSSEFSNIDELYLILQKRGTLILKNAVLNLPTDADKTFLAFHKLSLVNSKIVFNSSDIAVLCNEYEHEKSLITSFAKELEVAEHGIDGIDPGQSGAPGMNGLDGANANFFVLDKVKTIGGPIGVNLSGQAGGNGGDGSQGVKGDKGRNGRNCATGAVDCRSGCGNGHKGGQGGNGGNGGNGGQGGDGGKFEFRFHGFRSVSEYFFSFTSTGGKGGYYGNPGAGGEGGEGGNAGKSGCQWCEGRCFPGPKGDRGVNGVIGNNGSAGSSNYLINGNFDVPYVKAFLDGWDKKKHLLHNNVTFEFSSGLSETLRK